MARPGSLTAYAATRALLAVPMLFILLTAVFFVLRVLPGDPILALWGRANPTAKRDRRCTAGTRPRPAPDHPILHLSQERLHGQPWRIDWRTVPRPAGLDPDLRAVPGNRRTRPGRDDRRDPGLDSSRGHCGRPPCQDDASLVAPLL